MAKPFYQACTLSWLYNIFINQYLQVIDKQYVVMVKEKLKCMNFEQQWSAGSGAELMGAVFKEF